MLVSVCLSALLTLQSPAVESDYVKNQTSWRKSLDSDLRRPQGWLSLVGLSWLSPGENSVGSAEGSQILLPKSAPAHYGKIQFRDGKVSLSINGGASSDLLADSSGNPTRTTVGSVTFIVIKRGARTGVRIWDSASKSLADFKGCKWYPVNPAYRIVADWVPYEKTQSMPITNVLGDTAPVENPGYVTFKIGGKTCRLEAQGAGDGLFFNFQDSTTGTTTYPAGRFLDAPGPKDGKVILDFNRATNPPCAFTSYATCPLPPAANRLSVAIPAGEKTHHPSID